MEINWRNGLSRLMKSLPIFLVATIFAVTWRYIGQASPAVDLTPFASATLSLSVLIIPPLCLILLVWVVLGFMSQLKI